MSLRLLAIEDSLHDRQLFECLIEDLRRECHVDLDCELAVSGPQGLDLLERAHYDAVILDQHMPDMSGSDVLRAIRLRFPAPEARPKVLAYSTLDVPEFRRQCLSEGADGFASKYLGPRDFAQVLRGLGLPLDADGSAA